jgi:polygalacturonase
VVVNGVILRDPNVWACSLFACRNVAIANVKFIGLWRCNTDGIDICNSQEVMVRDSFVRTFDDSIVLKGVQGQFDQQAVRNINVSGCVVWNDWGKALEIGAETHAPEIADVRYEDCDIVHSTHIALTVLHGDSAKVRNITYKNVRVEIGDDNPRPRYQTSREARYEPKAGDDFLPQLLAVHVNPMAYPKEGWKGDIRNVIFEDVSVTGPQMSASSLRGWDAEHTVEGVTIKNLRFNGKKLEDEKAARISMGTHVGRVRFE